MSNATSHQIEVRGTKLTLIERERGSAAYYMTTRVAGSIDWGTLNELLIEDELRELVTRIDGAAQVKASTRVVHVLDETLRVDGVPVDIRVG